MVLYIFIVFFIISPFFPAIGSAHWFFRTADFVRIQSLVIQAVLLALLIYLKEEFTVFSWVLLGGLVLTMIYQLFKVFPYSSLFPRRRSHAPSDCHVSILAGNVLQTNSCYPDFLNEIKRFDPDLVLAMETNQDWEDCLSEIEDKYPYSIKVPLENFYGMHLYSKKELQNPEVKYQIEDDKPSIFFDFPTGNNNSIFFCCLHPAPPSPTENETSKERDAELMLTGKRIRKLQKPTVVCGDMNDVVWSRTTRLFKKMTGMIDPRVGRGFFSTFHAGYFFLRFPLDHLFHTRDLYVGKMIRSKNFGSDHFAMYYEIHHKKSTDTPKNPKLNGDEKEEINELIEEGKENQENMDTPSTQK
ncbi:endonuclease/exonuclease/phosphatase family protein [Aequorivita echinoideorum]|uniref:Endonuclease/exonuclease/phosphatase family protein n=1 Tax=Aequorivita echinoideorum TaxID=1549647 RepID=A0ABS5S0Q7_9FLAO|nr:endonuclease/exonuclease/phosphatase family protein [Aequorivita echinoideorum]MBT0606791.1 endonuclease/exonuclease/phosphatase family protein [Aequorivita echinoideorum]